MRVFFPALCKIVPILLHDNIVVKLLAETSYGLCLSLFSGRNSDVNLAVMGNEQQTGEDKSLLLEDGLRAAPPKSHPASTASQLFRLVVKINLLSVSASKFRAIIYGNAFPFRGAQVLHDG